MAPSLTGIALLLALWNPGTVEGRIGGKVVNASRHDEPAPGEEVYLQVMSGGEFVVAARARANADGRFLFEGVPADEGLLFLPGASREGIHYPGPRIALTPDRPGAELVLKVHDTTTGPNPLVIADYELTLVPEPGALRVTESLVIENPEPVTYVGPQPAEGQEPVTLALGVAADFERVTFDKEFYGRQFALRDGRLVTGLPWTPGRRELRYTYVLRNEGRSRAWTRPLDLPCRHVRLSVRSADPGAVRCSLGAPIRTGDGVVTFESDGRQLAAGQTLRVDLGGMPVPFMATARWAVLALLAAAIAVTWYVLRRRETPAAATFRGPHRRRGRKDREREPERVAPKRRAGR